jgi:hypothetical protein
MTEVDSWFLLGAAFLSAVVIGLVCFLEVSYRLVRRHHRAALIGLARLKTAGAAREIVPQPPTTAYRYREQLRIACVDPKREAKIAPASAQVALHKACEASETEQTQTSLRFCA